MSTSKEFVSAAGEWTRLSMHNSMGGFFHYARKLGLSPQHLGALMKMGREGAARVADLGGDFGVTTAAASQMLDRLVSLGLVTRAEDPEDRRAKRIALTERGRNTVDMAIQARHGWLELIASSLTRAETESACEVFKKLVEKARLLEREDRHS